MQPPVWTQEFRLQARYDPSTDVSRSLYVCMMLGQLNLNPSTTNNEGTCYPILTR